MTRAYMRRDKLCPVSKSTTVLYLQDVLFLLIIPQVEKRWLPEFQQTKRSYHQNVELSRRQMCSCSSLTRPFTMHLTSYCFLNSNPTDVITILETIMKLYAQWRSFRMTRTSPSSVMESQYLSIIGQRALMSRETSLKTKR